MAKKKASRSKWNRVHEFSYKKASDNTARHPAYIFSKIKKRQRKYLVFTRQPHTNGVDNIPLRHNIDSAAKSNYDKSGKPISHVRDGYFIAYDYDFEPVTDKKFRIHNSDLPLICSLKQKLYKGK